MTVLLAGLITSFTLSDETTQGVVTLCGCRIMAITPDFQSGEEVSTTSTRSNLGLMPTAGQLICNQIVWVRFPQCPQYDLIVSYGSRL